MSIPSLRQQMINEALDYHMNMNHVVFNRERRHIEVAGQQVLDPNKTDIIIEGNIRDRVSRIMTAIQKLIQTVQFNEGGPGGPGGGPGGPSGKPGGPDSDVQSGLDKTSVSASNPLKSKKYISDSISAIVSEYNGLCDYIDLQNRQRPFKQSDLSGIDGLVKQLVDPIKSAIGITASIAQDNTVDSKIEYTRIYNTLRMMMVNIGQGAPYQKVSPTLLTEFVPIAQDYEMSKRFDMMTAGNIEYLGALYDKLIKEMDRLRKLSPKTPIQKEANDVLINSIQRQLRQVQGYSGMDAEGRIRLARESIEELKRQYAGRMTPDVTKELNKYKRLLRKLGSEPSDVQFADVAPIGDFFEDRPERQVVQAYNPDVMRREQQERLQMGQADVEADEERKGYEEEQEFKDPEEAAQARQFDEALEREYRRLLQQYMDEQGRRPPPNENFTLRAEAHDNVIRDYMRAGFRLPAGEERAGEGKPKKKVRSPKGTSLAGGHVHKKHDFGDDEELAPYLTKHLKPSKYRKNVPPIVSSSEESSGDEGSGSDMEVNDMRLGKGKNARRMRDDVKAISKLPVKEAAMLVAKKGGRKRDVLKPVHKPAIKDSGVDKDLWFM
jgi:hypothetical protein